MSDKKDATPATPKPETPKKTASTPTVTLVVADFRVRHGKILVRREDSDALDAYYLYPADDWKKTKTVEVPASELARLDKPVNRLPELRTLIPTPTDWQIEAWKVGFTGGQLSRRELENACQQLVQRLIVRADQIRRWADPE